jgi:hypothetical protein
MCRGHEESHEPKTLVSYVQSSQNPDQTLFCPKKH